MPDFINSYFRLSSSEVSSTCGSPCIKTNVISHFSYYTERKMATINLWPMVLFTDNLFELQKVYTENLKL